SASVAEAGRVVHAVPLLWQSQDGGDIEGEPQTHPAPDAHSGHRSALSETESQPPRARAGDLPVSVARRLDRAAQPSLEHRYYVYSDAGRLPVFGRRYGLVQSLCPQLGVVQYSGDGLLPGGFGVSFSLRPTRDLELRSGLAVH